MWVWWTPLMMMYVSVVRQFDEGLFREAVPWVWCPSASEGRPETISAHVDDVVATALGLRSPTNSPGSATGE